MTSCKKHHITYQLGSLNPLVSCGAALLGGGYCHKANNFTGKTAKQLLPYLCGLFVALLVALLSLLIIVNLRGA